MHTIVSLSLFPGLVCPPRQIPVLDQVRLRAAGGGGAGESAAPGGHGRIHDEPGMVGVRGAGGPYLSLIV